VTGTGAFTYTGNPLPTVASSSPSSITVGAASTQIAITGTGYTGLSTVLLDGTQVSSTFTSSTQLTATIPTASLAFGHLARLTVTNPTPAGGASDSGAAFSIGPNLPTGIYGHTATVLSDGRVLICGGANGNAVTNSAEIYDPTTNQISVVGSMTTPRYRHTATLLNNGKVLVTGGFSTVAVNDLQSAEIFDPSTSKFTAIGNMVSARARHTATLLTSGKVLITGGDVHSGTTVWSELFDPTTNGFTTGPQMAYYLAGHLAVALSDGTVLIVGGLDGISQTYPAAAELYNPSTNSFTTVGSMQYSRSRAAAVKMSDGRVFVAGGINSVGVVDPAEIYSPTTRIFTVAGQLYWAVYTENVTLLNDGTILVSGGEDNSYSYSVAEIYNPTTGAFKVIPDMTAVRFFAQTAVLPSGNVLVIGGTNDGTTGLASTELYSPSNLGSNYLLTIQNPVPSIASASPTTTVAGDTLTITGSGFVSSSRVLMSGDSVPATISSPTQLSVSMPGTYGQYSINILNSAPGGGVSNTLQQTSHVSLSVDPQSPQVLPGSNTPLTVTVLGGGPYTSSIREGAAGGSLSAANDGHWYGAGYIAPVAAGTYHVDYVSNLDAQATATATITVSNSAVHASSITLQAPHAVGLTATTLASGKMLITGGGTGTVSTSNAAELLSPTAGSSHLIAPMILARSGHTATTLANGSVLVAGGVTPDASGNTNPTTSTEILDPSALTFSAGPPLGIARNGHFALILPTGDVLLAGGCTSTSATSTEIYKASSNTVQSGPALKGPHCGGKATTLASGLILFTGGYDPSTGVINGTAETYDSTANSFSTTGQLIQARYAHTATLLSDGRVLVAGGFESTGSLATTEYFDPVGKSFSQGPALVQPRQDHAAIQLPSGSIFVAGGVKYTTSPFGTPSTILEQVASTSSEVAILAPTFDPILLPVSNSSFMLIGGAVQTANLVTINTSVTLPPSPSISSCEVISSNYLTCNTYDLATPLTVLIDGTTYTDLPFTSYRFDINTNLNILPPGSHTIQVQNPTGKLSNILPFVI
jgi:hypothetical protein